MRKQTQAIIGKRIKAARLAKTPPETRKSLVLKLLRLGVETTEQSIKNWESGKNAPPSDILYAMGSALNVTGEYFFAPKHNGTVR